MGQVFWLPNCPALDGIGSKTRPVIIMSPTEKIVAPDADFIVVACTTRHSPNHPDAVLLPNSATHPKTTSGLKAPTWAIPAWHFLADRSRLGNLIGTISGNTLKGLAIALEQSMRHTE